MAKYYIDYQTGAGNEYVTGTLDDAKAKADDGAAYTQQSITIHAVNDDNEIGEGYVAMRRWYGVKFDPSLYEDGANVIQFGDSGHFDEWADAE